MKISWLGKAYGYGGNLMYYRPFFKNLADAFELKVYVGVDDSYKDIPGCFYKVVRKFSIRNKKVVNGVEYNTFRDFVSPSLILDLIKDKPDLIVIMDFSLMSLWGVIYALFARKRIVLLLESDPRFRGAFDSFFIRMYKKIVCLIVDNILTNNEHGKNYLISVLNVNLKKVNVAPYLTSNVFVKSSSDEGLKREEGKINFVFINSVTERKGVLEFCEGLKLLSKDMMACFVFHIVGDGEVLELLKEKVEVLGFVKCFKFYGRVSHENIGSYYSSADAMFSPTLSDYRSLTSFEALSVGLPLFVSIYDGAADEVVTNGLNGFVFDPRDNESIFEGLLKFHMLDDLSLLAEKSREKSQLYTEKRVFKNLYRFLTEI